MIVKKKNKYNKKEKNFTIKSKKKLKDQDKLIKLIL